LKESISTLIHAPSKVGKSTLMSTAPPPLCVFDVEGSWKFIRTQGFKSATPLRKIAWNPRDEPPPRYDGTWDAAMVTVTDWATLTSGYVHLQQSPHDFRSVIVDSVTEAQRKLKTNLRGLEQMRIQDWGDLLVYMDKWIRDIRDLSLIPELPIQFAGFVAETEEKGGRWRPAMQGSIGRALPYWVDICGYLYTDSDLDANGQATAKHKKLLVMSDHPQFESGERVQGLLGDVITDPSITSMMYTIYGDDVFGQGESK